MRPERVALARALEKPRARFSPGDAEKDAGNRMKRAAVAIRPRRRGSGGRLTITSHERSVRFAGRLLSAGEGSDALAPSMRAMVLERASRALVEQRIQIGRAQV